MSKRRGTSIGDGLREIGRSGGFVHKNGVRAESRDERNQSGVVEQELLCQMEIMEDRTEKLVSKEATRTNFKRKEPFEVRRMP